MKQDLCSIFLNKSPSGVLYTGDIVTGSVTFMFKNKQKVLGKDIDCRIVGKCMASWTRPMPTIPFIKHYMKKIKVFDDRIDIFDHYKGKTVGPGVESHSFHFTLPDDLPSTFDSSIGKVKYYLKLSRKTKCKLKEKTVTPIIVMAKVNLNHLVDFVTPTFYEIQKSFKFMHGNVSMYLKTYKGFAPKQIIPFEVGIHNEECRRISKIKVYLIQKIKYTIAAGYATEDHKVSRVEHKLNSNNEKELCRLFMEIPDLLPSSLHVSEPIIIVSYIWKVDVTFPFHSTCTEDIPVIVATVPVNHYDQDETK